MKKKHPFSPLVTLTSILAILISGCASTKVKSGDQDGTTPTDTYEVSAVDTPFYRLGPQQESGPDLSLEQGRLLTMVKRSYGFSRVTLDNGWTGYVATADIAPATVVPEPSESSNSAIVERYFVDEEPEFPPLPEQELQLSTGVASPTDPEESDLPRFRY